MSYKELNLRAKSQEDAATEIMYEIAACRADMVDLIRINISYDEAGADSTEYKRMFSSVIKLLKTMKQKGSIQFFATAQSFSLATTEAVFLQNKYPELFSVQPEEKDGAFIYIKI